MKTRPKEYYRCYNGTVTSSLQRYLKSWYDAARPFEKLTGLVLGGFNPGFQFHEVVEKSNGKKVLIKSYTISESFMERVIGGMELLKEELRQMREENKMLRGELELAESKRNRKTRKR